jgi:formate dehydrogenase major subunit
MDGLFVMGQNPAVGAPNARLERRALANLKWLVVRDMVEIETAAFWYNSPEIERGELRTEAIGTEVFFRSCGKRRRLHEYAAAPAVAPEGRRSAG